MPTKDNEPAEHQELSARKYVAISLLITGMSQAKVAKKLEVQESTVSKWCNDGLFMKVLAEQKNRILHDTVNIIVNDITAQKRLIQKAVVKNVESITSKITDKTTPLEHKAISEVLDKSLISLDIAPRFNSKVEMNTNYELKQLDPIVAEKIEREHKRVEDDMKTRDQQLIAATKVLELLNA